MSWIWQAQGGGNGGGGGGSRWSEIFRPNMLAQPNQVLAASAGGLTFSLDGAVCEYRSNYLGDIQWVLGTGLQMTSGVGGGNWDTTATNGSGVKLRYSSIAAYDPTRMTCTMVRFTGLMQAQSGVGCISSCGADMVTTTIQNGSVWVRRYEVFWDVVRWLSGGGTIFGEGFTAGAIGTPVDDAVFGVINYPTNATRMVIVGPWVGSFPDPDYCYWAGGFGAPSAAGWNVANPGGGPIVHGTAGAGAKTYVCTDMVVMQASASGWYAIVP